MLEEILLRVAFGLGRRPQTVNLENDGEQTLSRPFSVALRESSVQVARVGRKRLYTSNRSRLRN